MSQISIIVPVYNTEKYLHDCLDSILAQTFTDWEAILVDDGSKDNSGAICDEYSARDPRFKVHHKINGGVSSARNIGLDYVLSEYIMFIDSDDMLYNNALELLLKYMQDGIDSICCSYVTANENGSVIGQSCTHNFDEILGKDDMLTDFLTPLFGSGFNGYLWNRLFRTSIITENNLRFREDIFIKEDGLFLVQYLCRCNGKHYYSSSPVYKYRINNDSVMGNYSGVINYKSVTGMYGNLECNKEIAASSTNANLLKLSRESIVTRYLILTYSTIRAGKFPINDIFHLGKLVCQNVQIRDVFRTCWKLISAKFK